MSSPPVATRPEHVSAVLIQIYFIFLLPHSLDMVIIGEKRTFQGQSLAGVEVGVREAEHFGLGQPVLAQKGDDFPPHVCILNYHHLSFGS